MIRSRPIVAIGVITMIHAVVSVTAAIIGFAGSFANFDRGGPKPLSAEIALHVANFLLYPIFTPLTAWLGPKSFPGLWGYVPLAANSLLWGLAIYGIARMWTHRITFRGTHQS